MNNRERDTYFEYAQNTQTLIGQKQRSLLDLDTKEIIQVDQITKMVYGSKQFWKVYLADFLSVLGILDSRQLDVFVYIVENTDPSRNLFIGTYDKIGEATGACRQTIANIMKKLAEHNFVRKVQQGVYYVNPNVMMKGDDHKRQILLSYYENTEPVNAIGVTRQRREALPETEAAPVGVVQQQLTLEDAHE